MAAGAVPPVCSRNAASSSPWNSSFRPSRRLASMAAPSMRSLPSRNGRRTQRTTSSNRSRPVSSRCRRVGRPAGAAGRRRFHPSRAPSPTRTAETAVITRQSTTALARQGPWAPHTEARQRPPIAAAVDMARLIPSPRTTGRTGRHGGIRFDRIWPRRDAPLRCLRCTEPTVASRISGVVRNPRPDERPAIGWIRTPTTRRRRRADGGTPTAACTTRWTCRRTSRRRHTFPGTTTGAGAASRSRRRDGQPLRSRHHPHRRLHQLRSQRHGRSTARTNGSATSRVRRRVVRTRLPPWVRRRADRPERRLECRYRRMSPYPRSLGGRAVRTRTNRPA